MIGGKLMNKKTNYIPLIIVLVVILIGVGGYFFYVKFVSQDASMNLLGKTISSWFKK